jgi:cytochrome c oxidase cbb3-type subunit 4
MDIINELRAGVTVFSLAVFLGIIVWTWARQRRDGFEEAARLPFLDDDNAAEGRREQ